MALLQGKGSRRPLSPRLIKSLPQTSLLTFSPRPCTPLMPCTPLTNPHYPSPGERHRAICQGRRLAPMPLEIDASPLEIEERSTGDGISRAAGDARPHHIQLPHPQESTRRTTHHTQPALQCRGGGPQGPVPPQSKATCTPGKAHAAGSWRWTRLLHVFISLPSRAHLSHNLPPTAHFPSSPAHITNSPALSRPLSLSPAIATHCQHTSTSPY